MPLTEERAFEILNELIRSSNGNTEKVADAYRAVIDQHLAQFPSKKKRRRRVEGGKIGNQGWPGGVTRTEYTAWKRAQVEAGRTEGLNPRAYKAERDGATALL